MLYHYKEPEKRRALLLEPAGISAVNIGGTNIHSDLGIKPGTKLIGLIDMSNSVLRIRLSKVK